MIVVSDINPDLHRRAQKLVPSRYKSFDELLNVALENQLVLEQGAGSPSLAQIRQAPQKISIGMGPGQDAPLFNAVRAIQGECPKTVAYAPEPWALPVLWGQINRVLPIFVSLRILAHALLEKGVDRIPLGEWQERSTEVASELQPYLARLDRESERKRGDLWATGFPRRDRGSGRRYANQFLGRGSTKSPGGAEQLGFVVIAGEGSQGRAVGITDGGLRLASSPNPVLDQHSASETISLDEAQLYLDIVGKQLPEERRFMSTVAELIDRTGSRAALEDAIENKHPEFGKYVGTLRAGVIGRLHDLGCLTRTRQGTNVTYALSSRAKEIGLAA